MTKTVVVVEVRDGRVSGASFEAISAAQTIGGDITVVAPGADVASALTAAARADVGAVVALEHDALAAYTADGFLAALAPYLGDMEPAPDWIVFPHTYQVRDYVPALAVRLGRPLVTDCTGVKSTPDGVILTRPMFRGKVSADVSPAAPGPCLATFQAGAFREDAVRQRSAPVEVQRLPAQVDPASIRQRPEPPFREAALAVDLAQARRIVAVGRGIKDRERIAVAEELASALGAELAASRPICDAGWLPMDRQIGSSGQTVSPDLYVAVGISGAIQHIVGMRGARTVVAINKDPEAPIFEVADYGIVGDLFEVVPAIIGQLK